MVGRSLPARFRSGTAPSSSSPSGHRSALESGFARSCFLVMTAGFYTASGLSKLYTAGIRWGDGHTLQSHLEGHDNLLAELLRDHLLLAAIASSGALFLEAGAFLMLFSGLVRTVFLISLALMHTAIYFSMHRWYFPNVWCFILLIDWGTAWRLFCALRPRCQLTLRHFRRESTSDIFQKVEAINTAEPIRLPIKIGTDHSRSVSKSSARWVVAFGSALIVLMAAVVFFQIEWWPMTNVDLYSTYYDSKMKSAFPRSFYYDAKGAQQIARETKSHGKNRKAQQDLSKHVELRLVAKDGSEKSFPNGIGVGYKKQWTKSILRHVIVSDLLAKPKGNIDLDPNHPDNPASMFLWHIRPAIQRHYTKWKDYEYAILAYKLENTTPVIGKAPLEGDMPKQYKKWKNTYLGSWTTPMIGFGESFFRLVVVLLAVLVISALKVRVRAFVKNRLRNKEGLPLFWHQSHEELK